MKPRVILRRCDTYDSDAISGVLKEALSDLKTAVKGRIFIKPNVVSANRLILRR